MTPPAGTLVKALPSPTEEEETPTETLQGELQIINVKGDKDFNLPPFTIYLIEGTPVDPDTIEEAITAAAIEFANPCHDPEDGRFCETNTGSVPPIDSIRGHIPDGYPTGKAMVSALENIEKVHSVPQDISKVAVEISGSKTILGEYSWSYKGGFTEDHKAPGSITVSSKGDHKELTFTHEYGHYLEHQLSLRTPEVMDAIKNTISYQQIERKRGRDGQADYLLSDKESFARAYAQWISTKTKKPNEFGGIQAQIDAVRNNFGLKRVSQWDDDEFAPIAEAFDSLFREKGLLKESVTAGACHTFANPCHNESDGRFCEVHGTGSKAGAYRKAYDKVRSTLPDDPANWIPSNDSINGPPWSLPSGRPGPGLNAVEKKVNELGKILHNEIGARLKAQGLEIPESIKAQKERDEAFNFLDNLNKEGQGQGEFRSTSVLDRLHSMFPNSKYESMTKEREQEILKAIDKDHPGYLKARNAIDAHEQSEKVRFSKEAEYTLAYRARALEVLSEVRGGAYGNEDFSISKYGSTGKALQETVARTGQVYPDEWVTASNEAGSIYVKPGKRGLHNFETIGAVTSKGYRKDADGNIIKLKNSNITVDKVPNYPGIDKSEYYPTAVHEVGHRFEELRPHIKALEWSFWARRAGGERPQPLRKLRPQYSYKADENAVGDRYEDPYMGKIYSPSPRANFEIFTMGMQGMFGGSYRMWSDPDYSSFTLGLLAAG